MIFAECSFEQAEAGFECECSPFGHLVNFLLRRKVRNGEINVRQHILHYKFTCIARLVQVRIIGFHLLVIPRNVSIPLDLDEILVCTEESAQRLVIFRGFGVITQIKIAEHGIDVPDSTPAPSVAGTRDRTSATHFRHHLSGRVEVRCLRIKSGRRESRIEIIAEGLQTCLRREELFWCQ